MPSTRRLAEARRMLICGELFDVAWARTVGLVGEVVGAGEALGRAQELGRVIAARSPVAVAAAQAFTRGRSAACAAESGQYREGRAAFLAGRRPIFPLTSQEYAHELDDPRPV
ncbi:MAG: hypothetical protein QM597_04920 [Aeromicrobium sp.]|uniref:hypothetical protein n=1 Tax=Aeromicrobium sp. TaxID=1871063 RepID=UPI0039E3A68D